MDIIILFKIAVILDIAVAGIYFVICLCVFADEESFKVFFRQHREVLSPDVWLRESNGLYKYLVVRLGTFNAWVFVFALPLVFLHAYEALAFGIILTLPVTGLIIIACVARIFISEEW